MSDAEPALVISAFVPKGTCYRIVFAASGGGPPTLHFHDEEDVALWHEQPNLWQSLRLWADEPEDAREKAPPPSTVR